MPGTIASYASGIGISENYLSRLVKKATGRSVGAWIDIVRIQRAKRLLTETREPVIDIAAAVFLSIGGVIRLHLGDHFRIGSEGYVSTLSQRGNGSYLKYGWGGLLADYYTANGHPHGPRIYFGFLFYH